MDENIESDKFIKIKEYSIEYSGKIMTYHAFVGGIPQQSYSIPLKFPIRKSLIIKN